MEKKRISIFIALLVVFAVSFLLLFSDIVVNPGPPKIYHISMLARGKSAAGWAGIREGAALAADESNVELSFILLGEDNDAEEQISLLNREREAGVDAILLSAADSAALGGALEEMEMKMPVVAFESPVDGDYPYLSADNYAMGAQIGRQLLADGQPVRMALVESGMACAHIRERRDGFLSILEPENISPSIWELPPDSDEIPGYLVQKLSQRDVDVAVALDFLALEQTAQMVAETGRPDVSVYGIGGTDKILSYLEQGTISSIVVQNDFAMGYLSVKEAMAAIKGRAAPREGRPLMEYRLITGRNMYDPENQPLLFPFIR